MKPVNIGLLGLGTVGRGVAQILRGSNDPEGAAMEIERRAGRGIRIKAAVVRDRARAEALEPGFDILTDGAALVADPDIDIVCELMGGEQPALSLVLAAIANGKHVVTANKALIATHGNQIFATARQHGVVVAFEPAVAGGIPIIKAVREGLAANRIDWLAGIINGTGNFILTEMTEKGRAFEPVLAEAQALGYAEADPAFDVEGTDAAHKLTILASIAFGIPLQFDAVHVEGIQHITREDVAFASELGYRIKHLGVARRRADGIELRVHPTLIPEKRLIANVNGVMNAVLVHGDAVGPTLYYGPGAGSTATGSAVVADIIDIVRALTTDPEKRVPHLAFQVDALSDEPVLGQSEFESAFYLRLRAVDRPGVMADITGIFGRLGISIEAIIQKEPEKLLNDGSDASMSADSSDSGTAMVDELSSATVPIILLTRRVNEGLLRRAVAEAEALDTVIDSITVLRMEALG